MTKPIGYDFIPNKDNPLCVAQLKYSIWATGLGREIDFLITQQGLIAEIYDKPENSIWQKNHLVTVDESQIFQSGWFSSEKLSDMTENVKEVFIKNLPNMKISNIDADQNVYLSTSYW